MIQESLGKRLFHGINIGAVLVDRESENERQDGKSGVTEEYDQWQAEAT